MRENKNVLFLVVYVDDLIIATNSEEMLLHLKNNLKSKFNMIDLSKLSYCLGIEFKQNEFDYSISLYQRRYIENICLLIF